MPTARLLWALLIAFVLLPPPGAADAELLAPFSLSNQSPLIQIFGLPGAAESTVLAPGKTAAALRLFLASNNTGSSDNSESLLFDGETSRLTLEVRHGIGNDFEVGVEIPWVMHRKGFLDRFIVDWHDTFNLPQGGRDERPVDRLAYRYSRDGVELVNVDESTEGFGDLRLTAAWQLSRREEPSGARSALALHSSLKLPTGDSDRLLGSGSTDLALWLSAENSWRASLGRGSLYGAAGMMLLSDGRVLPGQQRNLAGFATLGSGWAPWERLALKVQLDGHTPFYGGSDLDELASPTAQLTLGGTLGLWPEGWLDLGVGEDLAVRTSPDVVFHLALRTAF
ncbi:hypothetical protein DSOUD_0564 [Desulfuromonas soudanensis]|uniref:DUF3187 family protein n=1 Tax=Desulfuromonas soudanensis TaxID=1603606 RepID=A0A0M3QF28_9BACT|nr:DUF3187 family protein [Desulfuromonas soudanensis]ALC15353.1 hypothetical protein DSOUD_0564 [Desulfuromonas soudanensis]